MVPPPFLQCRKWRTNFKRQKLEKIEGSCTILCILDIYVILS